MRVALDRSLRSTHNHANLWLQALWLRIVSVVAQALCLTTAFVEGAILFRKLRDHLGWDQLAVNGHWLWWVDFIRDLLGFELHWINPFVWEALFKCILTISHKQSPEILIHSHGVLLFRFANGSMHLRQTDVGCFKLGRHNGLIIWNMIIRILVVRYPRHQEVGLFLLGLLRYFTFIGVISYHLLIAVQHLICIFVLRERSFATVLNRKVFLNF